MHGQSAWDYICVKRNLYYTLRLTDCYINMILDSSQLSMVAMEKNSVIYTQTKLLYKYDFGQLQSIVNGIAMEKNSVIYTQTKLLYKYDYGQQSIVNDSNGSLCN